MAVKHELDHPETEEDDGERLLLSKMEEIWTCVQLHWASR